MINFNYFNLKIFLFPESAISGMYSPAMRTRQFIFHHMENKTGFDNIKPPSCGKVMYAVQER